MYVKTNNYNSSVYKGIRAEDKVSRKLSSLGIRSKRMPHLHPFDIELENGKRIDVKTALSVGKMTVRSHEYSFYRFRMKKEKKQDFADYFVLVLGDDYYVIPYGDAPSAALYLFDTGYKKSKWDKYLNAFYLLV